MVFGRRYRATEKIGSGGMADVFKAVDEVLGRTVAVKVMHPRYAADPTFAARFRQEAQAAANLQSPYIVNIYDWGQDGDTYYIVMEYVRGTDLKSIIQQKGALDSRRVAEIGAQVCSALMVAHGYDVIHRDIKPHNIMVTPDGAVKVMDFGIARAGNTTMTQTGSVLGTAHYVSPEQAQGRPLKAQSDLYSLGVVLFEAGTGRLPFDADTPVAVALKQVNEAPPMPRSINPDIDPGLEAVIMTALAKDPTQRYDTAEEMRGDLRRVAQGREVHTSAAPMAAAVPLTPAGQTAVMPQIDDPYAPQPGINGRTPAPRANRAWIWILLAVGLVLAGLGVAWYMGLIGVQSGTVPDLVGKTEAEAKVLIVEAGFTVGEITPEYNKEVPAGQVIDQSPVANASAEKQSAINLTVSKGAKMVVVPEIQGLPEAEAIKLITDAGFTPEPLSDEFDPKVEAGTVIRQVPDAGVELEEGSAIQYVVSRGVETVEVPNVVGKKRSTAEANLREAGFKVSTTEAWDDKVAAGLVISQNPNKGLRVAKGSTVTIVVSKGPKRVVVPKVLGRTESEARSLLAAVGLGVEVTYRPETGTGNVIEQSPSADVEVLPGTLVQIVIDGSAP